MYIFRNIEVRLCNHCRSGKAIRITYYECVFVALGIQHATCMRHNVICASSSSTIFFHIIWIGHILCRNCLLKQVTEGKIKGQIEATRRRGRRRKKLLDDLKDRRGYCQLKEEALDRTVWRNRFGRGFGPVVWQITDDDNDDDDDD